MRRRPSSSSTGIDDSGSSRSTRDCRSSTVSRSSSPISTWSRSSCGSPRGGHCPIARATPRRAPSRRPGTPSRFDSLPRIRRASSRRHLVASGRGRCRPARASGWIRAIRSGDRVPPEYDPMIAKVMAVAADRREAIAVLRRALDEVEVSGIQTTLPFDRALVRDGRFLADDGAELSTDWVADHWDGPRRRRRALDRRGRRRCTLGGRRRTCVFAQRRSLGSSLANGRARGCDRPMAAMTRPTRTLRVSPAPASGHADPALTTTSDAPVPPGHIVHAGRAGPLAPDGTRSVEVVVDGWRFVLLVEDERSREPARARDARGPATRAGVVERSRSVPSSPAGSRPLP